MNFSPLFLIALSFSNCAIFFSYFTSSQDRPKQMKGKSRFGSQHGNAAVCDSQYGITKVCGCLKHYSSSFLTTFIFPCQQ